ncbi:MAG: HEAT repeat domain-containing protein [Breznakibacter sp.]
MKNRKTKYTPKIIALIFVSMVWIVSVGLFVKAANNPPMGNNTSVVGSHKSGDVAVSDENGERVVGKVSGKNPWFWQVNTFGRSFLLVNVLIAVILFCIGVMLVLLIVILLNRARLERESRLRQFLMEKYQTLILDYLFGQSGHDGFLKIASDKYRREVLVDQIIDISINLKGDAGEKLQKLYRDLMLDKDSIGRAYSRKWHVKVKGFKELAFMNVKDANEEIYKALQSKNDILRMEAQIALVRLSDENPFEWLYFQIRPFSLWEQITLHSLMIQHEIPAPKFSQWLDSPNFTVVMFALRMIREYRQSDDEDLIFEVLNHENDQVRNLAIEVCGDLRLKNSLKILKSRYRYETYNNRLSVVRAIGTVADESMLNFLKLVLDKEDDVQLQIESTKAIESMGEVGVLALNKLMTSEYKNYQIIIRHVLDKRIV